MTLDPRYQSTVPAPLDGMDAEAPAAPPAAETRRADYEVAGTAGAEMADALAVVRQALDALVQSGKIGKADVRQVAEALDAAAKVAMQGRLLGKVASGSIRHSNEQVCLDEVLAQLLDGRQAALQGAGIELRRAIRPVTVVVDKDLVTALVDAALEWALKPGQKLEVSLEIKNWPAHGLLRIRTRQKVRASASSGEDEREKLSWHLVTELARAVGATLDRMRSPGETLLMLEFARTVREMEGISAMEVELGMPSAIGSSTRVLAGHRALIVTSDIRLREEAKAICQSMGLEVDNVPSSQLALQRCETEPPDIILVDERFNDEQFEVLRAQLAQRHANFPLIEIAYGRVAAHPIIGWGTDKMTSISRAELAAQLPQALAMEMSKIV